MGRRCSFSPSKTNHIGMEIARSDFRAGRAEGRALWHWTCAQMIAYLHEHPARRFTTVMGGALRSGGGTICRIDPAVVRFQAHRKCFNRANVLEHSLENRETVECISQFAMLLRVCNRQSP
jgi:hypothetical protein